MKTRNTVLLTLAVMAVSLAGCGGDKPDSPKFAKKVIDAVYAGNQAEKQALLGPSNNSAAVLAERHARQGVVLRQQYGEVKELKLAGGGIKSPQLPDMTAYDWTVVCERGTFSMTLLVKTDGSMLIAFFPPPRI